MTSYFPEKTKAWAIGFSFSAYTLIALATSCGSVHKNDLLDRTSKKTAFDAQGLPNNTKETTAKYINISSVSSGIVAVSISSIVGIKGFPHIKKKLAALNLFGEKVLHKAAHRILLSVKDLAEGIATRSAKPLDNFSLRAINTPSLDSLHINHWDNLGDLKRHYLLERNSLLAQSNIAGSLEVVPLETHTNYLIAKPNSGMTNRIKLITSAMAHAKESNRKLIIVWDQSDQIKADFHHFFDLEDVAVIDLEMYDVFKQSNHESLQSFSYNNLEDISGIIGYEKGLFSHMKFVSVEPFTRVYGPVRINFLRNKKKAIDALGALKPSKVIMERSNDLAREFRFAEDFVIGIHYRSFGAATGDHIDMYKDLQRTDVDLYIDEAKKVLAKEQRLHPSKKITFYIATDDLSAREAFSSALGTDKINFIENMEITRETADGAINALVEFNLLSRTQYIIGTRGSTFSDEAANLTVQRRKIHIGPDPYFKSKHLK